MIDPIYLIIVGVVVFVMLVMAILNRYRRCPSDKILVVYGTTGDRGSAKCVHGGGTFVWPVIQDYAYLSLTPIGIDANLTNALSRQNIRVDVPCRFTVGISTEPDSMLAAAERLLGLQSSQIQEMARDILFGQLRLVIATMSIEELNSDRDKFLEAITANVEVELKKIGLRLINVNVTDIKDESGYIEALGQEAAAKAINEAKVRVAEQEKVGEIGRAEAVRETRIRTAEANAQAVQGENEAKITIANSDANRREREAEALKRATAAENIQAARAMEESYEAQKAAEQARASFEQAKMEADVIVKTQIEKRQLELQAEAEAEQIRRRAKGEADAILMKMQAEADGMREMLIKQAEGFAEIVKSAGGHSDDAIRLMIADKMEDLVKIQVQAIQDLKIDKITVWDNGGTSPDGKSTTANFVSGLMKSVPPMNELFDMAGMQLPKYLGENKPTDVVEVPVTPAE